MRKRKEKRGKRAGARGKVTEGMEQMTTWPPQRENRTFIEEITYFIFLYHIPDVEARIGCRVVVGECQDHLLDLWRQRLPFALATVHGAKEKLMHVKQSEKEASVLTCSRMAKVPRFPK